MTQDDIISMDCNCEACNPREWHNRIMILCSECGNKRCPKATNHRNECTNSNEPGQKGSSYQLKEIND